MSLKLGVVHDGGLDWTKKKPRLAVQEEQK